MSRNFYNVEIYKIIRLKFLLKSIQTGGTPSTKNDEYFDGNINWFTPGDFDEKLYVTHSNRTITEQAIIDNEAKLFEANTVAIVGIGATLGKVGLLKEEGSFNQQVTGLMTNQLIEPEYLYYWILINRDTILKTANYTTLPIINNQFIKEFECPVPHIMVQKQIIKYLKTKSDEIFSIIEAKQKLIKLLEQQRQSIITEAVTKGLNPNVKMKDSGVEWIGEIPEHWEKKALKYCFKVGNGKEIENELDKEDNGIDVYGSGGVFKKTDKVLYNGESVLFGRKGTIGKPLFVSDAFWTVDTMYYTKFSSNSYPKWFYYLLLIFPWDLIATQTALPSVVGSDVANTICAIPPIEEQQHIADYLSMKDKKYFDLKNSIEQQIEKLKEYRQSLIYEAVTGKMDVREFPGDFN